MTEFYYGGQYIWKRMDKALNGFIQVRDQKVLPPAEGVVVSDNPRPGWTLSTWREVAHTRRSPLKEHLLEAIEELEREEVELASKVQKGEKLKKRSKRDDEEAA